MNRERILESLFAAVEQVNELLPEESRLEKSQSTALFGPSATLESLDCVNLVLAAEEYLNADLAEPLSLAAMLVTDDAPEPPETLGALADLISSLLERAPDA